MSKFLCCQLSYLKATCIISESDCLNVSCWWRFENVAFLRMLMKTLMCRRWRLSRTWWSGHQWWWITALRTDWQRWGRRLWWWVENCDLFKNVTRVEKHGASAILLEELVRREYHITVLYPWILSWKSKEKFVIVSTMKESLQSIL